MYLKNYEQLCKVISLNKKLSFSLKDFFFKKQLYQDII